DLVVAGELGDRLFDLRERGIDPLLRRLRSKRVLDLFAHFAQRANLRLGRQGRSRVRRRCIRWLFIGRLVIRRLIVGGLLLGRFVLRGLLVGCRGIRRLVVGRGGGVGGRRSGVIGRCRLGVRPFLVLSVHEDLVAHQRHGLAVFGGRLV